MRARRNGGVRSRVRPPYDTTVFPTAATAAAATIASVSSAMSP